MLSAANRDHMSAHSLIDWWTLAGVSWDYSETPNDWLADDPPISAKRAPTSDQSTNETRAKPAAKPATLPVAKQPVLPLPDDLVTFQQMWVAGTLGDDSGNGPRIAPSGPINPHVMVLTDAPAEDDTATVISGKTGVLLDNILRSCSLDPASVYRASFYPRAVLDRRAHDVRTAEWRRIAMHHIGLVQPEVLVVAGEDTVRALLEHDLSQKPPVLHFLNHGGRTIKMVVTRKLGLMLHRSAEEKAMAWQSWQLLLVE